MGRALRYLLHDRDNIFATRLDESIGRLGRVVLKSPPHSTKANAICERVIGTIRRECLDWLIPLSASHLRSILNEWVTHYNRSRRHMVLGPGVPDPRPATVRPSAQLSRHQIGERLVLCAKSVLGSCITNISLRPPARDAIFADHNHPLSDR
jgi:putative transposase